MTEPNDHRRWRERIAAAVTERRPPEPDVADHLATCAACSDEWRRVAGASARLIAAGRSLSLDAAPPEQLRARLLATRRGLTGPDAATRTPNASTTEPDVPAAVSDGPGVVADRRSVSGRPWVARFAWGGVGALVGAAAVVAVLVVGGSRVGPERLTLVGSALAPSASGDALLARLPDGTVRVTLEMAGLPRSGPADFYELWLVGDRGRVSAGTFRSDGSPIDLTFLTAANPIEYPRIGITLEPDDGDPGASNQRVAGSS